MQPVTDQIWEIVCTGKLERLSHLETGMLVLFWRRRMKFERSLTMMADATPAVRYADRAAQSKAIALFMEVWGIGPSHAQRLAAQGLRTLEDLARPDVHLTTNQRIGLQFHNDFNQRIPRAEMAGIAAVVCCAGWRVWIHAV